MNLLLLLSAMLSALSGVGGTLRAGEPYALAAQVTVDVAVQCTATAQPRRPVQALPTRAAPGVVGSVAPFALTPVEPIFAQRRRE
ncbi:MAG: hypothetical protein C0476_12570 [Sphingomonas sp.]|nr:hypothetical protein [Sphingomonas sp.]